jgi:hypothetical protein
MLFKASLLKTEERKYDGCSIFVSVSYFSSYKYCSLTVPRKQCTNWESEKVCLRQVYTTLNMWLTFGEMRIPQNTTEYHRIPQISTVLSYTGRKHHMIYLWCNYDVLKAASNRPLFDSICIGYISEDEDQQNFLKIGLDQHTFPITLWKNYWTFKTQSNLGNVKQSILFLHVFCE